MMMMGLRCVVLDSRVMMLLRRWASGKERLGGEREKGSSGAALTQGLEGQERIASPARSISGGFCMAALPAGVQVGRLVGLFDAPNA